MKPSFVRELWQRFSHGAPGSWYQGTSAQQPQSLFSVALGGGWSVQGADGAVVGQGRVGGLGVLPRPGLWQGLGHASGVSPSTAASPHLGEHKVLVALGLGPCMSRQGHARIPPTRIPMCTPGPAPAQALEPDSSPPQDTNTAFSFFGEGSSVLRTCPLMDGSGFGHAVSPSRVLRSLCHSAES